MTCCSSYRKSLLVLDKIVLMAAVLVQLACHLLAHAQLIDSSAADVFTASTSSSSLAGPVSPGYAAPEYALPEAPAPAGSGGNPEHSEIAATAEWHQPPFSRIGIGADVSLLGVGLKSAIVLNRYFDARLMGNFFHYNTGRIEVEGFNVNGNVHLASAAASLDWYPFNSIWRLSPGLMFFNDNQVSAVLDIIPGTSFDLNKQTFYSAAANPATGATPLTGTAILGLHTNRPAATIAGGFGKFIPRSNRHWSFPSEFGVVFTGAPSANVNVSGWACLDAQQTQCSNLSNPANPVTIEFNNALLASLTKWRKGLNEVQVYPIFTYSVVYSFNVR
jgi:hypothetical protein